MKATVKFDDDVAALLRRVQKERKGSLREVVNEALRQGLQQMVTVRPRRPPCRTRSVSLGQCLVGSIDDISEVLAVAEGEAFRSCRTAPICSSALT